MASYRLIGHTVSVRGGARRRREAVDGWEAGNSWGTLEGCDAGEGLDRGRGWLGGRGGALERLGGQRGGSEKSDVKEPEDGARKRTAAAGTTPRKIS